MSTKITLFTILLALCCSIFVSAQTVEELTDQKEMKSAELAALEAQLKALTGQVGALKAEVNGLTDLLTPYPRWKVGALGTVGLNLTQFNNWLQRETPNTSAATIGFTMNGFANLQQKKYFWRNGANMNLAWIKFNNKDDNGTDNELRVAADAFNTTSLFGYKFTEKLAASALGEYRTSLLDGRLNNPSYLDIGVGATWTPIQNLVVVFHPLNYNFVFAEDKVNFESSLGTKVVADYAQSIQNIAWRSNFSGFLSYKDAAELSNWTWVNSFSTAYKGIGVGFELGLRNNNQESASRGLANNPLQTYYVLGLSYSIAK